MSLKSYWRIKTMITRARNSGLLVPLISHDPGIDCDSEPLTWKHITNAAPLIASFGKVTVV